MAEHKIGWLNQPGYVGETWNPITGCSPVSEGCANCYAARMAKRLAGRYGYPEDEPFAVTFHPDKLDQPAKWKKPRCVFTGSMGDLFHQDVASCDIDAVMGRIALCRSHRFLVLTKRPERMANYMGDSRFHIESTGWSTIKRPVELEAWPLPNFWPGVTAENQRWANERIPHLMRCQAALRFVSHEPLLGPVEYEFGPVCTETCHYGDAHRAGLCGCDAGLNWLIIGPETGPRRRPCKLEWVRSIIDQGHAAGLPVYVKAVDLGDRVSKDPAEWPEDLRVREFPRAS